MLDAYAVRKAVPRILIAVIGINLSIYLCLAAVDITNVIGRGIAGLITTPFVKGGNYDFFVEGNVENAASLVGGAGIFIASGGLGAAAAGLAAAGTAASALATLGSLLILMIPIALVAVAVLATIVIRQALLVFLIMISPVAIACFVLPGTEQYFRKWFELFTKTLLVYPIIAAIFAMSDVFGSIIFNSASAGNDLSQPIKIFTGILVIYAPLVLIPFAFRFAGGVIGRLAAVATTGARKVADVGPIKGRREVAKRDLNNQQIQHRADLAGRMQERQSRAGNRFSKRAYRGLAGAIGGYNIEEQASAVRAQQAKVMNDQIATGRDEEIRGVTVNKVDALRGGWEAQAREDGSTYSVNGLARVKKDGTRQFQSLGGAWIDEAHVDAGHKRWGRDSFAQQAALSYEMRKAANDDQVRGISQRYATLATGEGGWGMSDGMAVGAFKGAGFENQNTHLEFKHTNFDFAKARDEAARGVTDPTGGSGVSYASFVEEAYEKKGTYNLSQMSGHTIKQLSSAYDAAVAAGDTETKQKVEAIAENFVSRYGGGGAIAGMDEERPVLTKGDPLQAGARGAGGEVRTMSQGAAHVAQEIRDLAVKTGVYQQPHPDTDTRSDPPPPKIPRLS